jgi:hypothetical protein
MSAASSCSSLLSINGFSSSQRKLALIFCANDEYFCTLVYSGKGHQGRGQRRGTR